MSRSCTENVSPCTERLEVRMFGRSGFNIEGLIKETNVIWKVDRSARSSLEQRKPITSSSLKIGPY